MVTVVSWLCEFRYLFRVNVKRFGTHCTVSCLLACSSLARFACVALPAFALLLLSCVGASAALPRGCSSLPARFALLCTRTFTHTALHAKRSICSYHSLLQHSTATPCKACLFACLFVCLFGARLFVRLSVSNDSNLTQTLRLWLKENNVLLVCLVACLLSFARLLPCALVCFSCFHTFWLQAGLPKGHLDKL